MTDHKNGVSIYDINQSAASWNISRSKLYENNDEFVFTEYVTSTLLSMGFQQFEIDSILPQLDINSKNEIHAIEKAIALLTPQPSASHILDEDEHKQAIIRQKELHLNSKPIPSEQIINNNPDLKSMLESNSDSSNGEFECIICMENVSKDQIWKNVCKHYDIVCQSYVLYKLCDSCVNIYYHCYVKYMKTNNRLCFCVF